MKNWFATVLVVAFVAFPAFSGNAQSTCGDRADLIAFLGEKFSEQPVAMGLTSSGTVIELLTSAEGSWTILITYPTGTTCMVDNGEEWEALPATDAGQES